MEYISFREMYLFIENIVGKYDRVYESYLQEPLEILIFEGNSIIAIIKMNSNFISERNRLFDTSV